MITYSTNWMGPIATRWYEDNNIPYVEGKTFVSKYTGKSITPKDYEQYAGGRIDIYGLDESEHWGGKSEYSLPVMPAKDWNAFSEWLDKLESSVLLTYKELISDFEKEYGQRIEWWSIKDDQ